MRNDSEDDRPMIEGDDHHQVQIARRVIEHLRERLDLERFALIAALGRAPTSREFADHACQRFCSDPGFRELVMAAQARAEAKEIAGMARALPAGAGRGGGRR
jgi:hypothetical protein